MLDVDALTDIAVAAISPAGPPALQYLVGKGEAPDGSGWTGGTPGMGVYKPFVTVVSAGAVPIFNQRMGTYDRDWQVNFTMKTFGADYAQWSKVSVLWRAYLEANVSVLKVDFGDDPYTVVGLMWQTLGPAKPNDATTVRSYSSQDSVALMCSKT